MAQVNFRPARGFGMQVLYAMEITGQTVGQALPGVLAAQPEQDAKLFTDAQKKYGMKLVDLIQEHRSELEEALKENAIHWDLDRIARIDRLLLFIAMAEISYIPEVPMKVAISEAVQVASKFSTDSSDTFVNGILYGFMQKKGIVIPGTKESKK